MLPIRCSQPPCMNMAVRSVSQTVAPVDADLGRSRRVGGAGGQRLAVVRPVAARGQLARREPVLERDRVEPRDARPAVPVVARQRARRLRDREQEHGAVDDDDQPGDHRAPQGRDVVPEGGSRAAQPLQRPPLCPGGRAAWPPATGERRQRRDPLAGQHLGGAAGETPRSRGQRQHAADRLLDAARALALALGVVAAELPAMLMMPPALTMKSAA